MVKNLKNLLIISDTQSPFHHKDTIDFLTHVKRHFKCTDFLHIGDVWDFKYLCRIGKAFLDPDDPVTPTQEYEQALEFTKELTSKFPKLQICHSNHGARIFKRAKEHFIPHFLIRDYKQILQLPENVNVARRFIKYGGKVVLEHGDRVSSGVNAAIKLAIANRRSTVIGHHSGHGGITYQTSMVPGNRNKDIREQIWGMNVGCMVDETSYGMAWAKNFTSKLILGCGVITWDGKKPVPHFIPYD